MRRGESNGAALGEERTIFASKKSGEEEQLPRAGKNGAAGEKDCREGRKKEGLRAETLPRPGRTSALGGRPRQLWWSSVVKASQERLGT